MEILYFDKIDSFPYDTVATIGMFDGVHVGHKFMLQQLSKIAAERSCKSVAITFKNHPRTVLDGKYENNPIKLLQTPSQRIAKIGEQGVDYLLIIEFTKEFAKISPKAFLDLLGKKVNLKLLLLGYDNSFGNPKSMELQEIVSEGKYKDIIIQRDKNTLFEDNIEVSSTEIRRAIGNGKIALANKMLEEEYSVSSDVCKGFEIGRTLGFPTANLSVPQDKVIPKNGVYATRIEIDGVLYSSVTNVGFCPTFRKDERTIETFIFDFAGDIYKKSVSLFFVDYIREERFFDDKEKLIAQIEQDCEHAKKILS